MEGEIVAVGPGARDEKGKLVPLDVKKGDRILFGKWSGTEVKIDGEDLLIMKESDIMGIIEGCRRRVVKKGRLRPTAVPASNIKTRNKNNGSQRSPFQRRRPRSACCAASTSSPTRSR